MKIVTRLCVPLLVACTLSVGCASTATKSTVQPKRSLDELYTLAASVNENADPYLLGSGDGIGQRTYDIYVEEVVMEHPKP